MHLAAWTAVGHAPALCLSPSASVTRPNVSLKRAAPLFGASFRAEELPPIGIEKDQNGIDAGARHRSPP